MYNGHESTNTVIVNRSNSSMAEWPWFRIERRAESTALSPFIHFRRTFCFRFNELFFANEVVPQR